MIAVTIVCMLPILGTAAHHYDIISLLKWLLFSKVSIRAKTLMQMLNTEAFYLSLLKSCYKKTNSFTLTMVLLYDQKLGLFITTF